MHPTLSHPSKVILPPSSTPSASSTFLHLLYQWITHAKSGIQTRVGSAGKVSYAATNPINTAVEVAKAADYAVVFVGFSSSEGSDRYISSPLPHLSTHSSSSYRGNLSLPYPQDDLIAAVVNANPNTIVVLNGPGPVLMPWANTVKGIIFGFFPGQESGILSLPLLLLPFCSFLLLSFNLLMLC